MADKNPKFSLIVSAVTQQQVDHPNFAQVIANWQQLGNRVAILIPQGTKVPTAPKVRWVVAKNPTLTLQEVATLAVSVADGMASSTVICDPFVVMRWNIFKIMEVAQVRQLGTSWLATSLALKVASTNNPEATELESEGLRWFSAYTNVWTYVARNVPSNIPFASPIWGGWIATWAYTHIHSHKYHDCSGLNAVGLLEGPLEYLPMDGFGKITTNTPVKDWFRK